ncbi:MAG: EAL domain-containing protein [Armatimonadetes bacterium]|nr:MAG: EAL domain-containing protein [Armatimonadota bacterium]
MLIAAIAAIFACAVVSTATVVVVRHKRAHKRTGLLAQYDPLTGLINRTLFQDRVASALSRARRDGGLVTLMFLDIDGFKDVNDRYGHGVGDDLLRQIAGRLTAVLRETDTVARLGGDEFTIIVEGGKRVEHAGRVATKVLKAVAAPYKVGSHELLVTVSIGISMYPVDGDSYEELMKGADTAMYQAKSAGKNTYQYFTRSLRDRTSDRLSLLDDLRAAIDSGDQLRLVYQPKVDVVRGTVTGLEALVRWQHPERGLLRPAVFVPLAEESDLIAPMSQWILDEACRDMKRWLSQGIRPMRVAVNVSDRMFRDTNLVESIAVSLAAADLDPRHLEVEVTERTITQEAERAGRAIERLADMGVKVSIDDFGTGASSLRHLQTLPIRTLKIDTSFVQKMHERKESEAIAASIIAIARCLDISVIAEGVESMEELTRLNELGCNDVQGYLIAHPLPPGEIIDFVNTYDKTLSFPPNVVPDTA